MGKISGEFVKGGDIFGPGDNICASEVVLLDFPNHACICTIYLEETRAEHETGELVRASSGLSES
jgi:hypothetical protein